MRLVFVLCVVAFVGCSGGDVDELKDRIAALEKKVEANADASDAAMSQATHAVSEAKKAKPLPPNVQQQLTGLDSRLQSVEQASEKNAVDVGKVANAVLKLAGSPAPQATEDRVRNYLTLEQAKNLRANQWALLTAEEREIIESVYIDMTTRGISATTPKAREMMWSGFGAPFLRDEFILAVKNDTVQKPLKQVAKELNLSDEDTAEVFRYELSRYMLSMINNIKSGSLSVQEQEELFEQYRSDLPARPALRHLAPLFVEARQNPTP